MGIALFSNAGDLTIITPPNTIPTFQYHCGNEFLISPLVAIDHPQMTIGIILLDNGECTIGKVQGSQIRILDSFPSGIMGKHGQGGQSQQRFERLHEEMIHLFHVTIADRVNRLFLEFPSLDGILIGGSSYSKHEFVKSHLLDYRLIPKIIAIEDTGYTEYQGIKEILARSASKLTKLEYTQDIDWTHKFMTYLVSNDTKIVYGPKEVQIQLIMGKLSTILITSICTENYEKILAESIQLGTQIIDITESESVSTLTTFGGIVGFLRF